jgi:3-oxoacyl-[acyl-carrier protein] reductase
MQIDLHGQCILVTGASRGIGAAIARALGQAGATVALHFGRSAAAAKALADEIGHESKPFQADLAQPAEVDRLYQEVLSHYGRIDTLVNNAGIALPQSRAVAPEAWLSHWQQTLQVNLVAAARLCHWALPPMQQQGGGRLIHIASRAAFRGDTPEYLAYAASKGGLVALSRSLARGYGKQGIKSFVIAPGFVETEMAAQFIEAYGRDYLLDDLALADLTRPQDVAPTAVLMASGLMDHATGCTVDINAGSYVR